MIADPPVDADTVAAIVCAVPGVAGLHPGMFGEVATYLPGRRVSGIRIDDVSIEVHLRVTVDAPVRETAAAVRTAVAATAPGAAVNVTVEEIAAQQQSGTPRERTPLDNK